MAKTTGITALKIIQDKTTANLKRFISVRDSQRQQLDNCVSYYVKMARGDA